MKRYRSYSKLGVLSISKGPWKEIIIDFITDLPPSKYRRYVYNIILIVVDRYTKMAYYLSITKKVNTVKLEELLI